VEFCTCILPFKRMLKLFVTLLAAAFQIVEPLSPHCIDASPDA